MSKINKKRLPSRHTSLGPDRAPHRSFYYAMGETEQDVAKPFVGVVSTWNEAAPCNTALMRQAQSVKRENFKKIESINKQISNLNNKLKNKAYVKNAPKEIVQNDKKLTKELTIEEEKLRSIVASIN
jgi:dihydroxyacid dehydratase/phosphogluconate dehydratase